MNTRMLGRAGPRVSAVGMVCPTPDRRNEESVVRRIEAALDAGVTFFDAGPASSERRAESLLGRGLGRRRDQVTLAARLNLRQLGSPAELVDAAERTLVQLGTPMLDLLILERLDDAAMYIEDVAVAVDALMTRGRVTHVALADAHPALVRRMHGMVPVAAVQADYSLWSREAESALTIVTEQLGIGLMPWSPMGQGYLTPRLRRDTACDDSDLGAEALQAIAMESIRVNRRFLADVGAVADSHRASVAQVACAWLLAKSAHVVPLLDAGDAASVDVAIGAVDIDLSAADVSELDVALERALATVTPWAPPPARAAEARWPLLRGPGWRAGHARLP